MKIQAYLFLVLNVLMLVTYPMERDKDTAERPSPEPVMVLGGLVATQLNVADADQKTPILGDIPLGFSIILPSRAAGVKFEDINTWASWQRELVESFDAWLLERMPSSDRLKALKETIEQGRAAGRRTNLLLEAILYGFNDELRAMLHVAMENPTAREQLGALLQVPATQEPILFLLDNDDIHRRFNRTIEHYDERLGRLDQIANHWNNGEAAQMLEAVARELQPAEATPLHTAATAITEHDTLVLGGLSMNHAPSEANTLIPILGFMPIPSTNCLVAPLW